MTTYDQIQAVNWSTLREIATSPKHYRHRLDTPRTDTPAMAFGRAAHCAVLEPDAFPLRYVLRPDGIDRRTKEGKEKWLQLCALSAGKDILDADDYRRCLALRDAVRSHPVARSYLDGQTEVVCQWRDEATGIDCKGRIDLVGRAIVDLKTTTKPLQRFASEAASRAYHGQMAFYHDGWKAAHGADLPVVLIVVEAEEPHDVAVLRLEAADALWAGQAEYRRLLAILADCRRTGEWPGQFPEEEALDLPPWAFDASEQTNDNEEDEVI